MRESGQAPKQIARSLGISVAEASRLVRAAAAQAGQSEARVAGCWISPNWSARLTVDGRPDWPSADADTGSEGLVLVLVARAHRYGKVAVCGYLVDPFCLGVKNALGPEVVDEVALPGFVQLYFSAHGGGPLEAPIELAREMVLGAVGYARGLGFEPHPDFAAAEAHLGTQPLQCLITFGRDGKPCYVSGPYDDVRSVLRTLERSVGSGNFDHVAITG